MTREERRKINSLIGFVSSIMSEIDSDVEIEDGITIAEGWEIFVNPIIDMVEEKIEVDF